MDILPTDLRPALPFWDDGGIDPARFLPLPALRYGYPDGWMAHLDLTLLHGLARALPGPVLEVGPWLGRSTSALASGIRDAARPVRTLFDIVDFGPTGPADWLRLFGQPFPPNLADGVAADAIHHPGGSIAVLINNLKRNELLEFATTITRGNFLDMPFMRRYGLAFCDTTHDAREVGLYLPRLAELLLPGAVVVFDDVIAEDFADLICAHLPVRRRFLMHRLDAYSKLLAVELR